MKINKITLYNIGPYINENVFNLTMSKKKNLVLIGGKNGAGKTTFFKSIKTCLYGCKVWGFDAPGKEYFNVIKSIVNMKTQYDTKSKAFIEIDLFFDDGKQQNTYTLHREWIKEKSGFLENFYILKNNEKLDNDEMLDFSNYLLSLIPPDMFNFYFFDGECIADYFLGNDGKNFKNAFLKLYGLDTLSLMVDNFQRNSNKKDLKNGIYENYNTLKNKLEETENKYALLVNELKKLEESLDLSQVKLQALQKNYSKEGGVSLEEWKTLNGELAKEEAVRDEVNRWLKEIANHYLPFIILKSEMDSLLNSLAKEEENLKSSFVKEMVNKKQFVNKLNEFLKIEGIDVTPKNIIKIICDSITVPNENEVLFDLSSNQIRKLSSQIEEKIEFEKNDIIKSIKLLNSSLSKSKKIREKLLKSNIDGFGDFCEEKEYIEKEILSFSLEIEKKSNEINEIERKQQEIRFNFEKAKLDYEKLLKSKSINDMASRAVAVYTLLEDKLIKKQSKILQDEFLKCFTNIINKNNFIDGIVVDKNVNIIPYKLIDVNYNQVENYVNTNSKTKFLDLFDYEYSKAINDIRMENVESAKLPSPITVPFSQGERQVFIMSLYLALLKTSRKDIPFFIDTPFARIDSNHRAKIVSEFFLGIENQIFILSTDEEIVGKYKKQIEKHISNKFMLNISGYGQTKIKEDDYFEE